MNIYSDATYLTCAAFYWLLLQSQPVNIVTWHANSGSLNILKTSPCFEKDVAFYFIFLWIVSTVVTLNNPLLILAIIGFRTFRNFLIWWLLKKTKGTLKVDRYGSVAVLLLNNANKYCLTLTVDFKYGHHAVYNYRKWLIIKILVDVISQTMKSLLVTVGTSTFTQPVVNVAGFDLLYLFPWLQNKYEPLFPV